MIFLIGLLLGYIIACTVFAVAAYLHFRYQYPIAAIQRLEQQLRPKGGIFLPKDEGEQRQERILAENDAAGRDTKLSELL